METDAMSAYIAHMTPSKAETISMLCQSALELAATDPWLDVSLMALCRASNVGLAQCASLGISKADVSTALDHKLDEAMLESAVGLDASQSVRETLFEIAMARFDAMEPDRAAWLSILGADQKLPSAQLARVRRRVRTAAWALEAAGLSSEGLDGAGRVAGMTRIFRKAESAWMGDTADLSRTMAHLDQELRAAEEGVLRFQEMTQRFFRFGQQDKGLKSAGQSADERSP
jgi:hypothetical protein